MADKRVIEQTASTELYNDDWFLKDSVVEGTTKISAAKLKELLGADGTQALEEIANAIAEEYDSTHTYSLNDWVFHEGTLYRCIGNNVTGTWNATKWQAKTIKQFISDSENLITGRLLQMFGEYMPFSTLDLPSIEAISKGDIFIYQRTNKYKFYRAKADHPQGVTEFDIDDWDEFDTVADLIEDVTEKIDEIEIPVKDVQVKTDSTYDSVVDASGNAKIDLSSVTAYGSVPNLPQAIATFKDGADAPMKSLKVAIEPQQDLHGYDAPWVGGAGKNKCPQLITEFTYSANAGGSQTTSGEVLVVSVTSTNNSGVYTSPSFVESYSQVCSYSMDIKADTSMNVLVGFTNFGRKELSLTNQWQRVTFDNITFNGSTPTLVVYGRGTAGTISAKNFMFELGSVSHDFAPYSNICPISGWDECKVTRTGKNLIDVSKLGNYVVTAVGDKRPGVPVPLSAGTYTISAKSGTLPLYITRPSDNYSYITVNALPFTFTLNNDEEVIVRIAQTGISFWNYKDMQLEKGSTATPYEPYNGHTTTINLDGTRYGGTLDVVNGVLTLTHEIADLPSLSWGKSTSTANIYFYVLYTSGANGTYNEAATNIMSNIYISKSRNSITNTQGTVGISAEANALYIADGRFNDYTVAQFKEAVSDVQLLLPLATPLTIQLTPTAVKSLLGQNNIWADTSDINECVYRRDMSSTIDDIIARLEALEG